MKKLIISIAILSYSLVSLAYKNEGETRSATVRVNISSGDVINIQAKYTELEIEVWDKNEVQIEATIRYDGKITDKIQSFLDQFEKLVQENIKLQNGELLIDSGTGFPNKGVKKTFFGLIVEINLGDYDEVKLEYRIKAPATNKYVITNSYRDVKIIGNLQDVELTQYSGDLQADLFVKAKLNLKYGSATLEGIEDANMEIYEQEIGIGQIKTLKLNAKYSDIEVKEIGKMDATSYQSDYVIGSIEDLSGNFKYGDMEITQGIGTARLTLYEEDIEAKKIDNLVLENSKYSKLEIARTQSIKLISSYEDEITIGVLEDLESGSSKYGKYRIDQLQGKFKLKGYEDLIEIEDVSASATFITVDGKYIDTILGVEDIAFSLVSNIKYGNLIYDDGLVEVRKYIKDSDQLEVELHSKKGGDKKFQMNVTGYEMKLEIN